MLAGLLPHDGSAGGGGAAGHGCCRLAETKGKMGNRRKREHKRTSGNFSTEIEIEEAWSEGDKIMYF